MRRINDVRQGIKWGEFREQFLGFFPISDPDKREEKLKEEYRRLTGKEPIDLPSGKTKKSKRKAREVNARSDESKGNLFGERERGDSNESEHGSTFPG